MKREDLEMAVYILGGLVGIALGSATALFINAVKGKK